MCIFTTHYTQKSHGQAALNGAWRVETNQSLMHTQKAGSNSDLTFYRYIMVYTFFPPS